MKLKLKENIYLISISDKDNIWSLGYKKGMPSIWNTLKYYSSSGFKVFHFLTYNSKNKVSVEQYNKIKELENDNLKIIFLKNYFLQTIYNLMFRLSNNLIRYSLYYLFMPLYITLYFKILKKYLSNIEFSKDDKIILYGHGPISTLIILKIKNYLKSKGYSIKTIGRYYGIINFYDIYTKRNIKNFIKKTFYKYYLKGVLANTDLKIITADGTKGDKLMKEVDFKNFYFIHDGIDIKLLPLNNNGINFPKSKINYIMVSRLVANKDIMFAVKAFHKANLKNSILHIFGDGELFEIIREYINKNNIENIKLYGAIDGELIPSYINKADAFVATSNFSNVSLGFLTALYLGKAVIATNVGGTYEYIINEKNGFLVNSIEELSKVLKNLDGKKEKIIKMGKESKIIAKKKNITTTEKRLKKEIELVYKFIN